MRIFLILVFLVSPAFCAPIIEQEVTKDRIYIKVSNGNTFTITRAEIKAHFLGETGSAATRKANTIAWLKGLLVAALGSTMIETDRCTFDFDATDDNAVMSLGHE